MTYLTVKHKVKNYKTWKEVFDNFESTRRSGGEKTYQVLREEKDPNEVHLIFKWDSPERAHTFFKSPELKDAMQKAGVVEEPRIDFLEQLDEGKL